MTRIARSEPHPAIKAMGLIHSMVRSGRISASEREMLEAIIAPAAEAELAAERRAEQMRDNADALGH